MELNPNAVAFIGLCREYCSELENAATTDRKLFIDSMLRLLPRLYISATDLSVQSIVENDAYTEEILDEDYYNTVRQTIQALMGEDDVYLEVFVEDMKYSDTPLAASISEGLADIFQALYNFINALPDATDETVTVALLAVKDDFKNYWSSTLCNVFRALNHIKVNS